MELMIEDLMEQVVANGGSDLHISAGLPPYIRISGKLTPTDYEPLTPEQCQRLIFSMLNNTQRKHLEQNWELDCSYGVRGLARSASMCIKTGEPMLLACEHSVPKFPRLSSWDCPTLSAK